jgi:hypothetical protein
MTIAAALEIWGDLGITFTAGSAGQASSTGLARLIPINEEQDISAFWPTVFGSDGYCTSGSE